MKANPGGYIPPDEVIGRDVLIGRLWRILEQQSLVLCSERRLGKTCVIRKMVAEAPQDRLLPIFHELEGVRTPLEFVEIVFDDVKSYLSRLNRTMKRASQFLTQIGGTEVGGVVKIPDVAASHWKILLTRIIQDLADHQDRAVTFFWDEVPLMLYNIKQRKGEDEAMEVLNTLRSLRQSYPSLRMVFTGSIGLHNVIISLKQAGDPTNDMHTIDVPPLSPPDAQELARRLLEGEGIQADDLQATAQGIAAAVDCIPYFIHHVVDEMVERGGVMNRATASEIVDACLTDPLDAWHMYYYLERINTYYAPEERPFALNLLDVLGASDQALPFDQLFNMLKSHMETEDSEMTRNMLVLLERDHYIARSDGAYRFRFPLIQRWWRLHRG